MDYNRRKFIKGMAIAAAAIPFSKIAANEMGDDKVNKYPINFFTKPLDHYEPDFIAKTLSLSGVEGFDLTVRPGGIVEPENIEEDLPKIIEAGMRHNVVTKMIVTSIKDTSERLTNKTLKVASQNGVNHYRLGYYDYDFKKGILKSLSEVKPQLQRLAQLNSELNIQGGYQNHSGIMVGAPMWDLWQLIHDISPKLISNQFDVRHAVTEGNSSWILSMNLLSKNIGSLAIKDFVWKVSNGKARVVGTPLGEGIVDFDLYFKTIKELNIIAPITLHIEYPLLSADEKNLTLLQQQKIIIAKIKKDVDFIRLYLSKYKIV